MPLLRRSISRVTCFGGQKMLVTSDAFAGRSAAKSRYEEVFKKLSPKTNCIVCMDKKELGRVSQALEAWAKRHVPGAKVRTMGSYPKDGKPRCWLLYPDESRTEIRGNWPKS